MGLSLDSANLTVTLPLEKRNSVVEACTELLQSPKCPIRVVARTIGVLVATFPAVPFGPLHFRCLEKEKTQALKESKGNYSRLMTVREGRSLEQLKWWIDNVQKETTYLSLARKRICAFLSMDASFTGWEPQQ